MRRMFICVMFGICFSGFPTGVRAQEDEIQQLLLNVEKLEQLKDLLENMKEKYRILNQGYQQVSNLTEGNFRLHEVFLNRLVQVNPKVRSYHRVGEIIQLQIRMIQAIAASKNEFRRNDLLNEEELDQVFRVFSSFSSSGLKNLGELTLILTDRELQMDDWERLKGIDRVYESMLSLSNGLGRYHVSLQGLTELRKSHVLDTKTLKNVLGQN